MAAPDIDANTSIEQLVREFKHATLARRLDEGLNPSHEDLFCAIKIQNEVATELIAPEIAHIWRDDATGMNCVVLAALNSPRMVSMLSALCARASDCPAYLSDETDMRAWFVTSINFSDFSSSGDMIALARKMNERLIGCTRLAINKLTGEMAFARRIVSPTGHTGGINMWPAIRTSEGCSIVSPITIKVDGQTVTMVYKLLATITLHNYVNKRVLQDPGAMSTRSSLKAIATSVAQCHRANQFVDDIQSFSFFVSPDGQITIADSFYATRSQQTMFESEVGRRLTTAPELLVDYLDGNPMATNDKTNAYSLGVLFCYLVTGVRPFEVENYSNSEIKSILRVKTARVPIPDCKHEALMDLISRLLVVDPANRTTVIEILNHPYFAGVPDGMVTPIFDQTVARTIATEQPGSASTLWEFLFGDATWASRNHFLDSYLTFLRAIGIRSDMFGGGAIRKFASVTSDSLVELLMVNDAAANQNIYKTKFIESYSRLGAPWPIYPFQIANSSPSSPFDVNRYTNDPKWLLFAIDWTRATLVLKDARCYTSRNLALVRRRSSTYKSHDSPVDLYPLTVTFLSDDILNTTILFANGTYYFYTEPYIFASEEALLMYEKAGKLPNLFRFTQLEHLATHLAASREKYVMISDVIKCKENGLKRDHEQTTSPINAKKAKQ